MTKTYLKFRSRITILSCSIIFIWVGLSVRLFQIMVLDSESYRERGFQQSQIQETLPYVRGNIFDRNNVPLTRNIIHYTLAVHPGKIKDKTSFVTELSAATGRNPDYYLKKIKTKANFVYLERNLRRSKVESILEKRPAGLIIERNARRSYPHTHVASQLIGYTDVDDIGLSGIEKQYNQYLQGTPGWVLKQLNGRGQANRKNSFPSKSPIDGSNIQLTIDLEYQSILQEELVIRMGKAEAKGAIGVLMNPQTGAILAMASVPDYDPNRPGSYPLESHKNRAVTDQFEPGSTFKIVTATAAVATGAVALNDEFYCENGQFTVAGKTIRDHEKFGLLTFTQIIAHSSNVGTIKIAQQVGRNSLYRFARNFGFGTVTGLGFPGETSGTLRQTTDWSEISLAEVAIGYEVGVTALQMAAAYSAIANGGYLMKPYIINQILSADGKVIRVEKPEVVRRVADPQIMAVIKDMLVQVVENGTGTKAGIKGWSVAGKTGTAYKFVDGAYSDRHYISNFVGFFPADDPQIVGVFILDEPRYGLHWGGYGAAPLFRRVMERIINMDDSIRYKGQRKYQPQPNIILAEANTIPAKSGLRPLSTVSNVSARPYTDGYAYVPEVRGMSIRKAKSVLAEAGLRVRFSGSGRVTWQSPKPGTKCLPGSICTMGLQ